jgi:predicted phage tail protein
MSDLIVGAGGGGGGKGGGGGGGGSRVPIESPESLRSKAFAQVLDLVCEGEIEGLADGLKSVYLDETPIQNADGSFNFQGVTLVARNGSQAQSYIPGFSAAEAETVVGVEVKQSAAVTRTINNANANAVRVRVSVPALTYQNPSTGDLGGTSVTYQIHIQTNGGGFVPQLIGVSNTAVGAQVVSATQAQLTQSGYGIGATFAFQVGGNSTGTMQVQYKPTASGTWVTMGTLSVTGGIYVLGGLSPDYPNRTSVSGGFLGTASFGGFSSNFLGSIVYGSVSIATPTLPLGTYDLRVVPSNLGVTGCSSPQRLASSPDAVISGKTTSKYERVHRIPLYGTGPWDVRVVRVTADSTSANLNNKTFWESYTEIIESKLRYLNTAVVGIKIDSSQFNRIPARAYDCKLMRIRIPTNATVRADGSLSYSGTWNGTFQVAWSSCPAWCFYDLITSTRYGCGRDIPEALIDKWALYSISKYCNELISNGFGGTEPRFSCNIYLQTREDAYKVLQDLASIFRGMTYWGAGSVTAAQDAPADPVMLYTPANVIDGLFTYQGSSLKTRHTVAIVSWNDPEDFYRAKQEYVEDAQAIAKYGVISTDVVAIGCTSRGQAHRVGRWLLYSEQLETETVSFRTGLDSALVRPGQIIQVADPVRAGQRMGGRVRTGSQTSITVDQAPSVSLPATLWVMMPNGTVESAPVATISSNLITISGSFSDAPPAQSVWMLETTGIRTQLFRVLAVAEVEGSQYEITGLAHNPSKYGFIENNLVLEQRDITNLNVIPVAPTELAVSESLYRYQSTVRSKISVSWRGVDGVNRYRVDWNKDNGNFTSVTTQNTDYELLDTTPGTYIIRVYSLGANGQPSSSYAEQTLNALGKTAPPADVTGFSFVLDPNIGYTLTWTPVTDLDLQGYEIRQGSTWATATLVTQVAATSYKLGVLPTGTVTYLIRALDTSNIYSATPASLTITVTPAGAPTVTATVTDPTVTLTWTPGSGSYAAAEYEVRWGASYASGVSLGRVKGTLFSVPATFTGSRTFWVAAVDIAGVTGPAGSVSASVTQAPAPTVTGAFSGQSLTLNWTPVTGSLATVSYELRQGATYAASALVATVQATAFSLTADWGGSRTFWVTAVDSNGNYGTPASYVATVSGAPPPSVTASFSGPNITLSWGAVTGTLETDVYEVRRGAVFASATVVATIKGTSFTTRVDWSGSQTFWVVARDINGTYGTGGSVAATVTPPSQPTVTQQVVDNNVLLRWNDVTATLPIQYYEVRVGSTWAGATVVGTKQGLFTLLFETAAGTYTYWLAGVDAAGNYGPPGSTSAVVNQPPDYVLRLNYDSTFPGTKTNIFGTSNGQLLGVNTTETWTSHFTSRGWNTPQDQINAGYPVYVMPSTTTASYVETIDYGTTLAGTKVTATLTQQNVTGSTTITPTISVSANGTTYTDYAGLDSVYATNFRYIRIRYDFASAGGDDLLLLTGLNLRLDAKQRTDTGTGTASAGDVGGTTVNFNVPFIDVDSISVTPTGATAVIAVYDFVDVPNPTSFKVLLFNTSGTRVSGGFSWTARGV